MNNSQDKYPTYSLDKVKSTVTNPSSTYKWISKEDEQRIESLITKYYSWASDFEKNQARNWLYQAALEKQRSKDLDTWRQEVKQEYLYKAKNAKSTKERNTYMSEVKKGDLADLIRQKIKESWWSINGNITDDGIIAGFIESNPQYEKAINRWFYSDDDAVQLGKDLWWIEKTTRDKTKDKVWWFVEWVAWWIPKFWEWVADALNLAWWEKESAWFENFVQENYWTAIANLTEKDLEKAKQAYANANKKEYEPNAVWAATKLAEWATDIVFSSWWLKGASLLKNNMFKAWFSAAAQTPWLEYWPEILWWSLWMIGQTINALPWAKQIRDSLQTEQDKADWDAFVGGNVLGLVRWWKRKLNQISDSDITGIKDAFDKIKNWKLNESIKAWIEEQKANKAQQITQGDINTRVRESKWLDYLDKQWKLEWIKSTEDFKKVLDSEIDSLKKEQTKAAEKDTKRYWENDILTEEEVPVLDSEWNKTTQMKPNRAFSQLLDEIIEHYEETDKSKATTFKSYKRAFKNWKLPMDVALEIKREWNNLWQSTFTKKSQIPKNSEKAEWWTKMMDSVNKAFDKLDIWEGIRSRDSKLSSLYSIKNNLAEVERRAADLEKKAVKKTWLEKFAGSVWNTVWKFINKISFWLSSLWTKAAVSLLSWMLSDLKLSDKTSYSAAEIKAKIPDFIKEYHELNQKLDWKNISKSTATKLVNAWIDKREATMEYNDEDED